MTGRDQLGQGFVLKLTGFLTNCPALATALNRQCTGDHRHISILDAGGLAQFAIYPPRLCQAIAGALVRQLKADHLAKSLESLDTPVLALPDPEEDVHLAHAEYAELADPDDEESEKLVAYDDVKGGELPVALVKKARAEEM